MRSTLTSLTAIAAITLLGGCSTNPDSEKTPASTGTPTVEEDTATEEAAFTLEEADAEDIDRALTALVEEVGEEPAQITELNISNSAVGIYAVDPSAPDELNAWEYRDGSVGPSNPVDYGGDTEALSQNLFSTADVSASVIENALSEAPETGEIEDGEVDGLTMVWMGPDLGVVMQISVSGERESGLVRFEPDGTFIEVL
ncbi:hypothetical protein [Nocardiopsis alba]|uniref:Putative lipoprotein n=1 Tax=Nocardiopsis alba (strain ATCC BAA-2165 / BE74) TaxID=1205910 RepID=J7L9N9_NOCAA|nr:hypothetical protein [Nocardiopsis alba]AFR08120.1 putative lipoprotein [Nocardiopsis alba ATCC BAA-2165]